jgi:hypothetical protein
VIKATKDKYANATYDIIVDVLNPFAPHLNITGPQEDVNLGMATTYDSTNAPM